MKTIALLLLLAGPALTEPASDPMFRALESELQRSTSRLSLPESPRPYFVAYDVMDLFDVDVEASLGGIVRASHSPSRTLGVGVRVGSPTVDNSNFGNGWEPMGFASTSLVMEDSEPAIRHDAWLLTDRCYKAAVENLARKLAARSKEGEKPRPPDFTPGKPFSGLEPAAPPPDADRVVALARELSKVFLAYPDIETSRVTISAFGGRRIALDSGGTRTQKARSLVEVRSIACTRAEDGIQSCDHATWLVNAVESLPSIGKMEEESRVLASRLLAWRSAPRVENEYVGPVLFTGDAAVSLFSTLLLPALSGTPAKEEGERSILPKQAKSVSFRLNRRVLPPGFTVDDDPKADPSLPSAYPWDDEGVPAARLRLVEDGVVQSLFASRTPGEDVRESNGHGRGIPGVLARGSPSTTRIEGYKPVSTAALMRQARKLAAETDSKVVLVVRRLQDPTIDKGDRLSTFLDLFDAKGNKPELPAPLEVVRLHADGHEEPVRGYRFESIDAQSLKDILGTGGSSVRSFMLSTKGGLFSFEPQGQLPVTLTAPDVLVGDVVLVPDGEHTRQPPLVQSPLRK